MGDFFESCKLIQFLLLVSGCRPQKHWCSLGSVIWCVYICVRAISITLNTIYLCGVSPTFFHSVTFTTLPDFFFNVQSFAMLCLIKYNKTKTEQFHKHLCVAVHGKHPPDAANHNSACFMCKKKDVSSKWFAAVIIVVQIMHYADLVYYIVNFYTVPNYEEYNLKVETIGPIGTVALSITYFFQTVPHYTYQTWVMFQGVVIKTMLTTFNRDLQLIFSSNKPDRDQAITTIAKNNIVSVACGEVKVTENGDTENNLDEGRSQFNKEKLKELRSRCSTLWNLVISMDDFLSSIILTYFISQAAMVLFFIYILISIRSLNLDLSLLVWAGLHFTLITSFFFASTSIISEIHAVAHDGRRHIQDMEDTVAMADKETRFQVSLLLDKLSGPGIGLTVGKLFLIDRSVIPTSLGVVLSYLVVMMQTSDSAQPCICETANMTGQ